MKKLLYLVPFILIGLSLTPFALYKDTVDYGASLDRLSPSHWKVLDMFVSFSGSAATFEEVDANQPTPEPEPLSTNATFKGFPFGAYFSRSEASSAGTFNVSAFSLLWGAVNIFLIAASLVLSFKVNRTKKDPAPIPQPVAQQPSVSAGIAAPQVGGVQPAIFTPTQPLPPQVILPPVQPDPQSDTEPQPPQQA